MKLESWFRALTTRLPNTDKDFAILHEDSSDSLFFVNRILLLDNLRSGSGSVPIWICTDDVSIQVSWNSIPTSMWRPNPLVRHHTTSSRALGHLINLLQDQAAFIQAFTIDHHIPPCSFR